MTDDSIVCDQQSKEEVESKEKNEQPVSEQQLQEETIKQVTQTADFGTGVYEDEPVSQNGNNTTSNNISTSQKRRPIPLHQTGSTLLQPSF